MAVRKFKPTTPGQRHKVIGVFKGTITATTPENLLQSAKRPPEDVTPKAISPPATLVVATSANTASLTLREQKTVFPQ